MIYNTLHCAYSNDELDLCIETTMSGVELSCVVCDSFNEMMSDPVVLDADGIRKLMNICNDALSSYP